ncbi:hypothetical protein BZA05DRAFT_76776 [Tricharina praecox]|uniref:uncharacterized protein n=1 Tax=Tricharina praecox TaxID=43433 RepID=UPI00222092DC|nr:uncharacterized protein BZA05DRAFT_76776 [Tricharina praecox]KAI5849779.1 hypothetical protein BZA05DRAFT_76776 [Tricharina praecox]
MYEIDHLRERERGGGGGREAGGGGLRLLMLSVPREIQRLCMLRFEDENPLEKLSRMVCGGERVWGVDETGGVFFFFFSLFFFDSIDSRVGVCVRVMSMVFWSVAAVLLAVLLAEMYTVYKVGRSSGGCRS